LTSYPGLKMSTISPLKIRRSILLILLPGIEGWNTTPLTVN